MSSKKLFLVFLLILAVAAGRSSAQDIPRIDQDFVQWTQAVIDGNHRPGSNGYRHPDPDLQEGPLFQATVEAFLDEDWALADELAGDVGYEVIAFRDIGDVFYGLIPQANNGDGRGFYFLRPRADVQRRLVIQAPHAVEDERTGVFGSEMFRATGARALMLTGADRCASNAASGCTGSTDCGPQTVPHTLADGAHAVDSFFQIFHQLAGREYGDTHVLQLHGFKADSGEPEFSVSDGRTVNQDDTYLTNQFYRNLEDRMIAVLGTGVPLPHNGNSCNQAAAPNSNFQCGTDSVQGRDLNSSTNACTTDATAATGRFIHLELSNDLRDPDGIYSQQLVIDTVNAIFPRTAVAGDLIWADRNGNGVQEAGERGVPGVGVEVLDLNDNVIGSTTTRAGFYQIGNLDAGTYRLRVQLPAGYSYGSGLDSNGRATSTFTLTAGESLTTVDAALVPSAVGQVGDQVWLDVDEDGLLGSEDGIEGIFVELLDGDTLMDAVMTDAQGFYSIPDVPPGNYRLKIDPINPIDFSTLGFTAQGTGVTDGDSEIAPATGTSPVFQLASGVTDDTRDAGLLGPCYGADLVASGIWKWWTPGVSDTVPSDWNQVSFTGAGSWADGFSPLGHGNTSRYVTQVNSPDTVNGLYTSYFRHTFEVEPGLGALQGDLQLTLTYRGGVAVYLNGAEILRRALPWGAAVGAGLPASTDADIVETVAIPVGLLSASNLLAVELHQYRDPDDNKLSPALFDLKLSSRVCGSCRLKEKVVASTKATTIKVSSTSDVGTAAVLQLGGASERSILIAWDLSSIPQGADVLQAEMLLFVPAITNAATNDSYAIHELLRTWNESGSTRSTWNQVVKGTPGVDWGVSGAKGAADSSPVRLGMMPLGGDQDINLAVQTSLNTAGRSVVEKWINNPATNFGFLIDAEPNSSNTMEIASDETSNSPRLRVIYLDPACQP